MSGIITGPHFIKYFERPDAVAIGTMVAVLEVGAFGMLFVVQDSSMDFLYALLQ